MNCDQECQVYVPSLPCIGANAELVKIPGSPKENNKSGFNNNRSYMLGIRPPPPPGFIHRCNNL